VAPAGLDALLAGLARENTLAQAVIGRLTDTLGPIRVRH